MPKEQIMKLLSGDNLDDYLSGLQLLHENIRKETLPNSDLNQDIIERACAVLILEKWVLYDGYFSELDKMMDALPNYKNLLNDSRVRHFLHGLSVFINSLNNRQHDISGFIYVTQSGWLLSMTAAEQLAGYFTEKKDAVAVDFFTNTAAFFKKINAAQFGILSDLMSIQSWNKSMANGFYNILTAADFSNQSAMLGCLYKVTKDPIVKKSIFGKYVSALKKIKTTLESEQNHAAVSDIEALLEMVSNRKKGK